MPTPPPPTTPRRAVLRGLASLLVLAAAVAGLPVLLAQVTTVLWDSGHDDLAHLLDRQDTGGAFLLALVGIAWIAWAHFAFCVFAEIPAQLRGRSSRRARRLNISRHAAATLISSILVLLPTSTALATPSTAVAAPTAEPTPGTPTAADRHQAPTPTADRSNEQRTYTVREARPAESLWSIAEAKLGDGERWRQIAALNQGRTMADGTRFDADAFLQPGWTLLLPDTGSADDPAGSQGALSRSVTVAPGDTLSAIADTALGDPARYNEIFDLNKNRPGPDGRAFTDPDQIYPGQRLALPPLDGDRASRPDDPQRPSGGHADDKDRTEPSGSPSKPDQPTRDPEASSRPQTPPQHHGRGDGDSSKESARPASPAPTAPQQHPDTPHQPAPEPDASSDGIPMRAIAGIGALLAAVLVGGIGLLRLIQQRRRKPGQTIAMPDDSSRLEQALTASATPANAELLDTALRTLAHHTAQTAATLPTVRGARVTARTVELLPDEPGEAMPPFTAGPGGWWTLGEQTDLLDADQARTVPTPYPGLATLGTGEDGSLYLANLPQLRTVLVDGDQAQVDAVCTALALETGMSPWADQADILLIGLGRELPRLLPTSRIRHLPHATAAIRDLGERLLEAHQDPELGAQLPWMLICAARISQDEAWQLADALDKARGLKVAAILPASGIGPLFPDATTLDAHSDGAQEVEVLGARLRLQSVSGDAYEQLLATLSVAEQPARPATGVWKKVPPEPAASGSAPAPEEGPALEDEAGAGEERSPDTPFPALIGAASDPAGLRLLSPAVPAQDRPKEQDGDDIPDTPTASPSAQAAPDPDTPEPESSTGTGPAEDSSGGDEPEAPTARDLHAPEIRVLGPIEVTGVGASGHGPKLTELAVLLYFRPHRDAAGICEAMDPMNPWSPSTLNSRMYGLRNKLGTDPDGNPYLPRRTRGSDGYNLSPAVRCDWTRFQQLAERGLTAESSASAVRCLEQSLGLVRGRPFGGRDLPWAAPLQQEMISRIVDVAHTLATYRSDPVGGQFDLDAARRAIAVGIDVEPTAELLYRDWMRIEHAAGNRGGLHTAITSLQHANRALDLDLEPETEHLISHLLTNTPSTEAM
ncbi:LysM peptidoglycan-binding domain-containing protein [Streptomyces sp. NPDC044780]|uniref:LysM peptidoglycan-binding domain-containing protein n=1 Tax=unclassified Streptomyces TaxID=2593676 RepID=UPI003405FDC8